MVLRSGPVACAAVAGLCLAGCATILGTDEYGFEPVDGGTGKKSPDARANPDAGPMFDPEPHRYSAACVGCLIERCGAAYAACVEAEGCSKSLLDGSGMDPTTSPTFLPNDTRTAVTREAVELGSAVADGAPVAPGPAYSLFACLQVSCSPECGRNYSCVGRFRWPDTYPRVTTVHTLLSNWYDPAARLDGWRVRACQPQSPNCDHPPGEALTKGGFASVAIDLTKIAYAQPEFDGYLLVDPTPDYYPITFYKSGPFLDQDFIVWAPPNAADTHAIVAKLGIVLDPRTGILAVLPSDCSYVYMKGVTVEVWLSRAGTLEKCPDCITLYPDDNNLPDVSLTSTSTRGNATTVLQVPPGEIVVALRETESGRVVSAVRKVDVRAGYTHILEMFPLSQSELAQLPAQVR